MLTCPFLKSNPVVPQVWSPFPIRLFVVVGWISQSGIAWGSRFLSACQKEKYFETKLFHSRAGALVPRAPAPHSYPASIYLLRIRRTGRRNANPFQRRRQLCPHGLEGRELQFAATGSANASAAL